MRSMSATEASLPGDLSRQRQRRSGPRPHCRDRRPRADLTGAPREAPSRLHVPAAGARRPGGRPAFAYRRNHIQRFGSGAIRPTLTGTGTSRAAATSDRRRSRSEVMAKNSTIPQPSAAPPISPDAKVSAIRRFTPPSSTAAGSITRLEDTRLHSATWHPRRTAAASLSAPGRCPLRNSVAQLACTDFRLPRAAQSAA